MIGSTNIVKAHVVKKPGSMARQQFKLRTHINKTCSAVYYHNNNIRLIPNYLSEDAAKILVRAYVMQHIDYCNSILHGIDQNASCDHVFDRTLLVP